jgi:hypothetical protein
MDDQHRTDAATVPARNESRAEQALTQVRQALAGLKYGQIVISVQDGVVIQIERVERVRLNRSST